MSEYTSPTTIPQSTSVEQHAPQVGDTVAMQYRETVLSDLLGPDLEFAYKSGLIDMFYYNPETAEDGLLHTLTGDIQTAADGTLVPGGFHHEPSARDSRTYATKGHLEEKNAKARRDFLEFPYNPYAAKVVVDGFAKTSVVYDEATGERRTEMANNGMFPQEYDALAIMQTIKQALGNRDTSRDTERDHIIISNGTALMLDGKTQMRLRLWLDKDSGKVLSAFPQIVKGARLKMDKGEVHKHLGL